MEAVPDWMVCVPRIMALRPEAQTLLIVVLIVEGGRVACRAIWRAGFWPRLGGVRVSGGANMIDA